MFNYDFKLPTNSQLLSCYLSGVKVRPVLLGEGQLRVPVPMQMSRGGEVEIRYTYTARGEPLDAVDGRVELNLPLASLFTRQLKWKVLLPEEYEATALEGNVVIANGGGAGEPIHLSKQIYLDEAPSASLNYTRVELR